MLAAAEEETAGGVVVITGLVNIDLVDETDDAVPVDAGGCIACVDLLALLRTP